MLGILIQDRRIWDSTGHKPLSMKGLSKMDTPGFPKDERMGKWFAFDHLPAKLQTISRHFHDLGVKITQQIEPGPERTVALRKLLEAKDAAVRAAMTPGG